MCLNSWLCGLVYWLCADRKSIFSYKDLLNFLVRGLTNLHNGETIYVLQSEEKRFSVYIILHIQAERKCVDRSSYVNKPLKLFIYLLIYFPAHETGRRGFSVRHPLVRCVQTAVRSSNSSLRLRQGVSV